MMSSAAHFIPRLILLVVLSIVLAAPVFAQDPATSSGTTTKTTPTPRTSIQEKRQNAIENTQEKRAATQALAQEKRENFQQRAVEKRVQLQANLAEKRAAAASRSAARKETFREKLALIKDTKKQAIVERADKRIDEINAKRTTNMSEHLARLSTFLDKIASRAAKVEETGTDVTAVESQIETARVAISAAQAAVEAQAGKTYIIEIPALPAGGTDEAGLKSVVGEATSGLQEDLKNTRQAVVDARAAVQEVLNLLKTKSGGVTNGE